LRIQLCRSVTPVGNGVPGATIGFGAESRKKSPDDRDAGDGGRRSAFRERSGRDGAVIRRRSRACQSQRAPPIGP
jgi:hypothetical protein